MECKNHPGVTAVDRCRGCAESFCSECLVEIQGQRYCGSCKVLALKGGAPVVEEAAIPCKEAKDALIYAIVGIFCFGIILEPIALIKASKARKMMKLNPRLTGSGKVTAATVIASVGLFLWVLGIIARVYQLNAVMR
jgi:hypothetical protein